jgi:predicted RNase H-like HicB family nuclease
MAAEAITGYLEALQKRGEEILQDHGAAKSRAASE